MNANRPSFEDAFDAGAVDYIYKPFDRTTLVTRVKSALRAKEDLDRIKELNQELFKKKQELSNFSHTVSHDLKSLEPLVDRLIAINYGEKIAEGEFQEVMKDQAVISSYLGVPE